MNKRRFAYIVVAVVIGLSLSIYWIVRYSSRAEYVDRSDWQVMLYGKNHQAVDIFDPNDPRIRIVYFGFTRCPDVCPTSLAMLSGAMRQVDYSLKTRYWPIFISLDPERDNSETSAQYAQYFHPMIVGLSASLAQTTKLARHYGVIFRKTELPNSKMGYTLDHSSYFYFLKSDGTLIEKVPHTNTPQPIVNAMKRDMAK
ncbi:SCO family protein [Vibrio sp. CAIM 722]|uniref:SCO family protein n=1 Tax=Vibrio eleionomae TaxID=2653505 RepID=A0A7X4RWB2_9VIBR|nr:SCO family protein [Vibrio eleionomae]MZI95721.1 SCO family protein [Vibrio eleionomae]